jgi:hypothetical protein
MPSSLSGRQPGHRDTEGLTLPHGFEGIAQPSRFHAEAGGKALFNRPTFLLAGEAWDYGWRGVVADSGNHCLRILHRNGRVGTLAGSPGEPGTRDGVGAAARFTELRGLPLSPSGTIRYIADGHAIRCLDVATEEVTTPIGVVDTPGFAKVLTSEREDRVQALKQPCLHRPTGITTSWGSLLIADQGNQSVRVWKMGEATLYTLVGDAPREVAEAFRFLGQRQLALQRRGLRLRLAAPLHLFEGQPQKALRGRVGGMDRSGGVLDDHPLRGRGTGPGTDPGLRRHPRRPPQRSRCDPLVPSWPL